MINLSGVEMGNEDIGHEFLVGVAEPKQHGKHEYQRLTEPK